MGKRGRCGTSSSHQQLVNMMLAGRSNAESRSSRQSSAEGWSRSSGRCTDVIDDVDDREMTVRARRELREAWCALVRVCVYVSECVCVRAVGKVETETETGGPTIATATYLGTYLAR